MSEGESASASPAPERLGRPRSAADLLRMWTQREEYTSMTPQHAVLARLAGRWKVTADFDFGGYGPNFHARGEQVSRLIFDGRYLETSMHIHFAGMKYESLSFTGFDNVTAKFQTVLFDRNTNGMAILEGGWEEATESIREFGEISNPMFRTRHDLALHRKLIGDDKVKVRLSVPDNEGKFFDYLAADLRRIGNET
jgi:hypothetical protein